MSLQCPIVSSHFDILGLGQQLRVLAESAGLCSCPDIDIDIDDNHQLPYQPHRLLQVRPFLICTSGNLTAKQARLDPWR